VIEEVVVASEEASAVETAAASVEVTVGVSAVAETSEGATTAEGAPASADLPAAIADRLPLAAIATSNAEATAAAEVGTENMDGGLRAKVPHLIIFNNTLRKLDT
jgi:hypothetical protein